MSIVLDKEKIYDITVFQKCLDLITHSFGSPLFEIPLKETIIISKVFLEIVCDENLNIVLRKSTCTVLNDILFVDDNCRYYIFLFLFLIIIVNLCNILSETINYSSLLII